MSTRTCSCVCRRRDCRTASSFRDRRLLRAVAAPVSSRRLVGWVLSTLLLASFASGIAADATRCAPKNPFSCCTPAVCSRAEPAPCCSFLLGSDANDNATCAALGELFLNDWGQFSDFPCMAGWAAPAVDDGNGKEILATVDYTNGIIDPLLSALIADYTNVATSTEYNGSPEQYAKYWTDDVDTTVPRGWVSAAVGIHTDYCTFYGVRCDDLGRVINLCAPSPFA